MDEFDNQAILELELMQDELEYLQLASDFFEDQTEIWGKLINKVELKQKECLKEEQELIKIFNEKEIEKEKLISHLKALKEQVDTKAIKGTKNIISKNGFFKCPECPMNSKWKNSVIYHIKTIHRIVHKFLDCPECHFKSIYSRNLKNHLKAVHRKLRPYKCLDCDKGLYIKHVRFENIKKKISFFSAFSTKTILTTHQKLIHATKKDWACDCCGSRYGTKHVLRNHMMLHLPPSFACSKCPKKFVFATKLKNHLKIHAGILKEVCKTCKKAYSTKNALTSHILQQHFFKLHCEISYCSFKSAIKYHFKQHLKTVHKKVNPNLIEKLIEKIDKLKPNFQMMKHV